MKVSFIGYQCAMVALLLMGTSPGWGESDTELSEKLKKIITKSALSGRHLGIWIGHSEDSALFELNSKKKMIPASLTKLITAAAALDELGPAFQFKTALKSSSDIEEGQLKGDLYLVGGGDPAFVSESMWKLVNRFVRTGVKTVKGDLIVDESRFDGVRIDPGRDRQRVDRAYDAPISAMSFNWNAVNIYVRPGKTGGKGRVFVGPESAYIHVVNSSRTSANASKAALEVRRVRVPKKIGGQTQGPVDAIRVKGKVPVKADESVIYRSITRPALWSGYQLLEFLKRRGIEVTGKVRRSRATDTARVLAEVESKPLAQLVVDMQKFSNNFVAEMLTKNLGAEKKATPASMADGLTIIFDFLEKVGLKDSEFHIQSPSGLSRRNRISAYSLARVLEYVKGRFEMEPEFITALPIAGVDGTLKRRMNGSDAESSIRAKTGMLSGVAGLAGYAGRKDGRLTTFVFMYNGVVGEWKARKLFDKLSTALVKELN